MFKIFIIFVLSLTGLAAIGAKQIIALEYATGTVSQTYGASAVSDDQTLSQYGFKLGAKENGYR
ncbi:MAG: hypothetical protein OEW60_02655, partial [Thiovulaceae bacterium]|nr:hypothetical protein [Sulfurimonadaceae bacterium]